MTDSSVHPMETDYNYARIAEAIEYLTEHFQEQPDLEAVARKVHLSPFHFQRIFTEWAGVSPKKFVQYLSLAHLRTRLHELPNLQQAAEAVGLSAQSRVYDLFVNIEGVTPQAYKTAGEGLVIRYGFHDTPFGECLLALADRGICALAFVEADTRETEFNAFARKWAGARLERNDAATAGPVRQIFERSAPQKMHLLVQGTNFQLKVWEALLRIPPGAVATYEKIAETIGQPRAVRAVGTAIGQNPVALLIPCHRVIRKTGAIGAYHWTATRKKALLGCEMARIS